MPIKPPVLQNLERLGATSQYVDPYWKVTYRGFKVATVEKNGTIAPDVDLAAVLGAPERPNEPISKHPRGHSHGPNFGRFGRAFTAIETHPVKDWSERFLERAVEVYGSRLRDA